MLRPLPLISALLLADDMGWGGLRWYGNARLGTASPDRLQSPSVEVRHFSANCRGEAKAKAGFAHLLQE